MSILEKETETLKKFAPTQEGVDCAFYDLPSRVQEIALTKMGTSKNENELVQKLDGCEDLRGMLGSTRSGLLKKVDPIVRYYRYKVKVS